jgi:alpha-methylacyl-CoA racemase
MRPLAHTVVVELRGRAPVDFAGLVLADLGARVICVEPPPHSQTTTTPAKGALFAGRERICLDLTHPDGQATLLRLVDDADVVLEGFRPGVAERLGVGPDVLRERRPNLVYARITGYGQTGPMARRGGHDLNYLAMSGALGSFGRDPADPPVPPLNLLGDFAGGSFGCVIGILAALLRRDATGAGALIDASMAEGASYLSTFVHHLRRYGSARSPIPWSDERGGNVLNGAAPFYDTYRTREGRLVAFAAIEPQFFEQMIVGLRLDRGWVGRQNDRAAWPELRAAVAAAVAGRTLEQLEDQLQGFDACFSPVLDFDQAPNHPQHRARGAFRTVAGEIVPTPSPVIDGEPSDVEVPDVDELGQSTVAVLNALGLSVEDVRRLLDSGVAWSPIREERLVP